MLPFLGKENKIIVPKIVIKSGNKKVFGGHGERTRTISVRTANVCSQINSLIIIKESQVILTKNIVVPL